MGPTSTSGTVAHRYNMTPGRVLPGKKMPGQYGK